MAGKFRFFDAEGDVEGHSAGKEIEVEAITLTTTDGEQITAKHADEDVWEVTEGPGDIVGHGAKFRI